MGRRRKFAGRAQFRHHRPHDERHDLEQFPGGVASEHTCHKTTIMGKKLIMMANG